jgi:methylmalonyl-CoA/ethylmalonyl-CoA epimerase
MTSPAAFSLSELGQIALTVRDVAAATAFYRDVLGLKFLFSAPPGLTFFAAGSVRLMLSAPGEGQSPQGNSVLYFKVEDIHAAQAALKDRGAKFEGEPHCVARLAGHDLWMAFLRDPEANLIGLMAEVKR